MELLAPAGNFECLTAAVQNGADAVYFAGQAFGARSYADNFDRAELERAVDYCHLRGCKTYITVNTLVLDKEFHDLSEYILFLNNVGADAVIVQDLGVVSLIEELCPELPVHASTQMSVHNAAGAKKLESIGAKRVVLARELSKNDIIEIADTTNIELEVFVHGAMCMSYSGQCLLSSMLGGRSGNRGKCAQPCRLPYRINSGQKSRFYLSLKDMSLLTRLTELQDIGVTSLKIEGRMKGPAYVAATVQTYRRCLDSGTQPTEEELRRLDSVFFRGGYSEGYFTGQTGRKMFAFDKPDNPYQKESTGIVKELANSFTNTENIHRKLTGVFTASPGDFPKIQWECDGFSVSYAGKERVQAAHQRPLTPEIVRTQIQKTGGTVFKMEALTTNLADGCFLSAKALNELRRESLLALEKQIVSSFKRQQKKNQSIKSGVAVPTRPLGIKPEYRCSVLNMEQFCAVAKFPFSYIGVPLSLAITHTETLKKQRDRIILIPPAILREEEWKRCLEHLQFVWKAGFRILYIHNISMLNMELPFRKYGSFRLNVFNKLAAEFYLRNGCESITLSPELNLSQMRDIAAAFPTESIVYGRLPLMVTENCIIANESACPCSEQSIITDRLGISFPVVKDDNICRSVVLNAKPIYMADKLDELERAHIQVCHLMFTTENMSECASVCSAYFKRCADFSLRDYTRAHFYKGV